MKEFYKAIPPFKDLKAKTFEIFGDSATVIDSFGTPHIYKGQNGKITIPSVRLTSYLRNAPEMKISEAAAEHGIAAPRKREMDRSIVLRILPSSEYKLSTSRCSMYINEQAKDKSLVLQVANFSDKTKNVEIEIIRNEFYIGSLFIEQEHVPYTSLFPKTKKANRFPAKPEKRFAEMSRQKISIV